MSETRSLHDFEEFRATIIEFQKSEWETLLLEHLVASMANRVLTYPTIIFSTIDKERELGILKENYGFRGGIKFCSDLSLEECKVVVRQALESRLESELLISEKEKNKERMNMYMVGEDEKKR